MIRILTGSALLASLCLASAAHAQADATLPLTLDVDPVSDFSYTQGSFSGLSIPANGQEVTIDLLFTDGDKIEVVSDGINGGNFVNQFRLDATGGTFADPPGFVRARLINPGGFYSDLQEEVGFGSNFVIVDGFDNIGDYDGAVYNGVRLIITLPTSNDGAVITSGTLDILTTNGSNQLRIVPEPTSLALLSLGGLLVARRRR